MTDSVVRSELTQPEAASGPQQAERRLLRPGLRASLADASILLHLSVPARTLTPERIMAFRSGRCQLGAIQISDDGWCFLLRIEGFGLHEGIFVPALAGNPDLPHRMPDGTLRAIIGLAGQDGKAVAVREIRVGQRVCDYITRLHEAARAAMWWFNTPAWRDAVGRYHSRYATTDLAWAVFRGMRLDDPHPVRPFLRDRIGNGSSEQDLTD